MKYLTKFLFVISALISLIISLLFLLSLMAWMSGGGNVLFPGLGLVVAIGFIVIVLFIMMIFSISVTVLLYKSVFKKLS